MKRVLRISLVALASGLAMPSYSFACGGSVGWGAPAEGAPPVSLEEAVAKARTEMKVEVSASRLQAMCGDETDYVVIDSATNEPLGSVPVPRAAPGEADGRFLLARLEQLLKTPRDQLVALRAAGRDFREDVDGLNEDLGIGAYVPNAYPIEKRVRDAGQGYVVYVDLDIYCSGAYIESPSLVSQGLVIKTLEYIPGRTDYSPSSVYRKGDLKKAILADGDLMAKIKERAASNALHCRRGEQGASAKWIDISRRLNGAEADLLKSPLERFQAAGREALPVSAYMRNANRIVLEFKDSGPLQLAGTIDELVELQSALSSQGVPIDRRSRLDFSGKLEVESASEHGRPVAASLRE